MNENSDIRVVRGQPSSEELATAIAVVQAALDAAETEAASEQSRPTVSSTWNRNHGMLRQGIQAGASQWGASFKDGLG